MLDLTQNLYGRHVHVGDLYRNYTNPFGKIPSSSYKWTQLTPSILKQASHMLQRRTGRQPRFFIEVGSFAGGSAMVLGRYARSLPGMPPVLCFDTWLGDVNMALGRVEAKTVDKRHGEPTLYHQFLVNMISANLTQHVLPMMAPSFIGAKMLSFLGLEADVIYLDSAHEARETFLE